MELTLFKPGQVFVITKYNCNPSTAVCIPTYQLTIKKGDGTVHLIETPVQTIYPYSDNITTLSGQTWNFEFSVKCNNNNCPKYIIKFRAN